MIRPSYMEKKIKYYMKKLFAECPNCGKSKLFMTEYNCLNVLMNVKNWIVCKNCDYAIQIEKLKSMLCCV